MPTTSIPWRAVAAAAAVLLVPIAGCGDDRTAGPAVGDAAQQARSATPAEVELFNDGAFEGIPAPSGAAEAGEMTSRAGAVAQSFTLDATSPVEIMDFYAEELPRAGWQVDEAVRSTGIDSYEGSWVKGNDRLQVSALLAQGVDDARSQFSLVLIDGLVSGEELNDGG